MTTDPAPGAFSDSMGAPETSPARGAEWAERHLALLRELSDMGMQLARNLTRQVLAQTEAAEAQGEAQAGAGEAEPAPRRGTPVDPGLTFSRISRAVRLTLALEARMHQAIEAAAQGAAQEASQAQALDDDDDDDDEAPAYEGDWAREQMLLRLRKVTRGGNDYEIRRAVEETIEASSDDPDEVERLKEELMERLDEDEVFLYRASWPIGEAIALICQDLGLTPDWDRWESQKWARKEAAESPLHSPYATVARPPLPANQHPRTGTECYRQARGLPPLTEPPPLRMGTGVRGPP